MAATLFHVASGNVPFRPHGGRDNKDMMFVSVSVDEFLINVLSAATF